MQDKRYQVFLSSTYEDLKEERRSVEQVIISSGDFPVGMEAFPAADEDQFEMIKSLIDVCDYYVLIIAGRYGSLATDNLSFTEKEFRYAVSKGVPVLVMVHKNKEELAAKKTERTDEGKEKLEKFILLASEGRIRKSWDSVDSLKLAVYEALSNAKATKPRVGWVRGDAIANESALTELIELRRENERFKSAIDELHIEISMPEIPNHNDLIEFRLTPVEGSFQPLDCIDLKCSWLELYPAFQTGLTWSGQDNYDGEVFFVIDVDKSRKKFAASLLEQVFDEVTTRQYTVTNMIFERLRSYYIEAGFMHSSDRDEPFTQFGKKFFRRTMLLGAIGETSLSLLSGDLSKESSAQQKTNDTEIPF